MLNQSQIETLIVSFLSEKIGDESANAISRDANLLIDGTLDSVSVFALIARIESELNIKIPPKDLVPKNFMTLNAMIAYLTDRLTSNAASQP